MTALVGVVNQRELGDLVTVNSRRSIPRAPVLTDDSLFNFLLFAEPRNSTVLDQPRTRPVQEPTASILPYDPESMYKRQLFDYGSEASDFTPLAIKQKGNYFDPASKIPILKDLDNQALNGLSLEILEVLKNRGLITQEHYDFAAQQKTRVGDDTAATGKMNQTAALSIELGDGTFHQEFVKFYTGYDNSELCAKRDEFITGFFRQRDVNMPEVHAVRSLKSGDQETHYTLKEFHTGKTLARYNPLNDWEVFEASLNEIGLFGKVGMENVSEFRKQAQEQGLGNIVNKRTFETTMKHLVRAIDPNASKEQVKKSVDIYHRFSERLRKERDTNGALSSNDERADNIMWDGERASLVDIEGSNPHAPNLQVSTRYHAIGKLYLSIAYDQSRGLTKADRIMMRSQFLDYAKRTFTDTPEDEIEMMFDYGAIIDNCYEKLRDKHVKEQTSGKIAEEIVCLDEALDAIDRRLQAEQDPTEITTLRKLRDDIIDQYMRSNHQEIKDWLIERELGFRFVPGLLPTERFNEQPVSIYNTPLVEDQIPLLN